jgi:REP element-mobilizing transposase RayT
VLVSKFRRKIFNKEVLSYLKDMLERIKEYYPEIEITEVDGGEEHMHFLTPIPPDEAAGSVVNIVNSTQPRP